MGILAWIVFGLVVGIIAKLVTPGRDPGGFIITMLLGIAGALLGGFIGRAMGFYGPQESAGWLMSIGGAILLLVLYRLVAQTPGVVRGVGDGADEVVCVEGPGDRVVARRLVRVLRRRSRRYSPRGTAAGTGRPRPRWSLRPSGAR